MTCRYTSIIEKVRRIVHFAESIAESACAYISLEPIHYKSIKYLKHIQTAVEQAHPVALISARKEYYYFKSQSFKISYTGKEV